MKYTQYLHQNNIKQRDARWHHIICFFASFNNELKISRFTQLVVLKSFFIFAPRCDVCGCSLHSKSSHSIQSKTKSFNKLRIQPFLFLIILPNFLGKFFLEI